jgi:hypothetical protein
VNGWVFLAMHITFVGDLADYEPPTTYVTSTECSQRLVVVREEMIEKGLTRLVTCEPIESQEDIERAREFYWDEYVNPFRG